MALANTSRAKLAFILEGTFGTTPVLNTPNPATSLRMTGESLAFGIKTDTSKEIRDDRMTADVIQVSASSSGGFNFELSAKEYDPLLQATLCGSWADYGTLGIGSTFSATIDSTAGTITAAVAPTGANAFTTLVSGQWIRIGAPTDAADGAFVMVSGTPSSTVITVNANTPIPGTGSRAAITGSFISASRIKNGTTERSFSIERSFQDVAQFFMFKGLYAGKLGFDFKSGSITTGHFDFMGTTVVRTGSTGMPAAPAASQTYDVQNAIKGVGYILENGAALSGTFVKSVKLDLDNKLRGRDAIGVFGNASIGLGTIAITGTMDVYLANGTLYDKFLNNTASSIAIATKDGAGNGYVVTLPKLKYGDAKVNAGAIDQDAMISLPFTAIIDPATNAEIIIDRLYAA